MEPRQWISSLFVGSPSKWSDASAPLRQENGESLNSAINRILAESLGVVPEGIQEA